MPGTTSTALLSFSHDQHHKTDAAKWKYKYLSLKIFIVTDFVPEKMGKPNTIIMNAH